jgi:hypothetical protein
MSEVQPPNEIDHDVSVSSLLEPPFGFSPSELLFHPQEDGRFRVLLRLRNEEGEFDGRNDVIYRQREIGPKGDPLTAALIYPQEREVAGIAQGDIGLIPLVHKNIEILLGDPNGLNPDRQSIVDIITHADNKVEAVGFGGEATGRRSQALRGIYPPIPVVVGSDPTFYQYDWGTGQGLKLEKGRGISRDHFVMFVAHTANGLQIPHLYVEALSPKGTFIRGRES